MGESYRGLGGIVVHWDAAGLPLNQQWRRIHVRGRAAYPVAELAKGCLRLSQVEHVKSCFYRVCSCAQQRQTLTIYHVHVLCAYPHVCESVSLFGHCVIFHLPHTHTPLCSSSLSHSSLTSPRIYYARILRAACSNLLLYCCLPWGRVRRGN